MKTIFKKIYDAYVDYYRYIDEHISEADRHAIMASGHNPYCPWVM